MTQRTAGQAGLMQAPLQRLVVPVVTAALVSAVFAGFWWLERRNARDRLRDDTRITAEQVAVGIQSAIMRHTQLLTTMHVLAQAGTLDSEGALRRIGEAARDALPGLVALRRVGVDGSVRWRASLRPQSAPPSDTSHAAAARRRAAQDNAVRVAPLHEDGGGARLIFAYLPVWPEQEQGELLEAVFDSGQLVAPVIGPELRRRFRFRVTHGGRAVVRGGGWDTAATGPVTVRRPFRALGDEWVVELRPRDAPGGGPVRGAVLVAGALITLLALWLARRLGESRRRLSASEARFRDFADIAADWFWEVDANLRYTFLSERYEEVTGIPRHRVLGRSRRYVLGEAGVDEDELRRQGAAIDARKPFRVERRTADADGHTHIYVSAGRPVFDGKGRFLGYRGIGRDVTEQRATEQRLREAAAVFDASAEAIMVTDPDDRIVRVNRAFETMTGYPEAEVVGERVDLLRSDEQDEAFYEQLHETLRKQGQWRGETWDRHRDGHVYPVWQCISEVRDAAGRLNNYVYVILDVTQLKDYQSRMEHLAHHDALTGLANRVLATLQLEQSLERARRHGAHVAVLFLDVDGFKKINDARGHAVGDRVLCEVAQRLRRRLRAADTVARIAGDEFLVVLDEVAGWRAAGRVAAELASLISEPFVVDGEELIVTVSIGVAVFPRDGEDVETLTGNADAAMYRAKEEGRNRYRMYTEEITAAVQRRLGVERRLRRALERRELTLNYQPQFAVASGELLGAEALARWEDDELGRVAPDEFVAVAEDAGMIEALDQWVMHTACEQVQVWAETGIHVPRIAVNVSGREAERGTLATSVQGVLAMTGLAPERLELEFIESYLMRGERMTDTLDAVRACGIRFSVDDFGTGYSSLAYLKQLPVDALKIDRSFVERIDTDTGERAIVEAIVTMAHTLGMTVVAEGVETARQLDAVRAVGCDVAQGYLLGRPVPAAAFAEQFGLGEGSAAIHRGGGRPGHDD